MALLLLPLVLTTSALVLLAPLYFYMEYRRSKSASFPIDWPLLGVLPSIVSNLQNWQDYVAVVLASGNSFMAHGPLGTRMRFFITCDPENVRHIFTSNHSNYPKGEEFAEIFDVMAGSFFTIDGEPCRQQRAKIKGILSSPRLLASMAICCRDKMKNGFLPFLTRMASTGAPVEMRDLITRLVFDLTATPVFGVDPGYLCPGVAPVDAAVAMDTVMEVAMFRHIVPAPCWKVMRRLNLGPERRLAAAHAVLHGFVEEMMEKRERATQTASAGATAAGEVQEASSSSPAASGDILSSYIDDPDYNVDGGMLLRATLLNYMIAGRDTVGTTLPWLFYSLAMNPRVVSSIRKKLAPLAERVAAAVEDDGGGSHHDPVMFEPEDTRTLVYLQAVILESLRLYPPGPIERKTVVADDVMPSGHRVRGGDAVVISLYAMGRMESVWGKDSKEYRPERWLSDGGKLRYVPSHKFLAFNSGPRMCLGKEIAVMQMKTVVAAVVWNFDLEVLEGQDVGYKFSCLLQMKNGLNVKVKKRATNLI